ncbi:hypothetical protein ONS95_007129 [Cadophora gregata]|uniref:uncharacterized protein n=1 Tax=Cadophora gregata TaxID=51156 RepID=UPI0026DA7497|nr:uncharacterized protein ONS95_007129 [Cadophora gregata]KAK0100677.1 hypothetical protein ONS95_007129 [Cadophora gregata]KAK0117325.1 hypothetical protein ONS96_013158 [Cadophora gregata f. sp. sojae]
MHSVPERYAAWKAGRQYVRPSELNRRAFPPQNNAKYFRKVGFFYPSTTTSRYNLRPEIGASGSERSTASTYKKEQNQIAACVETFWAGDVQPFDGIIEEFEEWLADNPRMGVRKLQLELGRWEIGLGESKPVTDISFRSLFIQHLRRKMRNSLANLR